MEPNKDLEEKKDPEPKNWLIIKDHLAIREPGEAIELKSVLMTNQPDINLAAVFARSLHPAFQSVSIKGKFEFPTDDHGFKRYVFPLGVSFINVTFESDIDLSDAQFFGPAYFWNCTFKGRFAISRALVSREGEPIAHRAAGEVNFSYSRFEGPEQPQFNRAQFDGQAYFHRTVFLSGANFEGTRFLGGVIFKSLPSDICTNHEVLKRELYENAWTKPKYVAEVAMGTFKAVELVFTAMVAKQLLIPNSDYKSDHWDYDSKITEGRDLLNSIMKVLLETADTAEFAPPLSESSKKKPAPDDSSTPADPKNPPDIWLLAMQEQVEAVIDAVVATWESDHYSAMFAKRRSDERDQTAPQIAPESLRTSFRNAEFGKLTAFRHVDLSPCYFLGTHLSEVEFTVVDWAQKPCCSSLMARMLPSAVLPTRSALRDEWNLPSKEGDDKSLSDLGELYRELRIAYDKEGDTLVARDFYFGELEVLRLAKPKPWQVFSVSWVYKVFAGYSKREGLALAWLAFYMLLLFPAMFWMLGCQEHSLLVDPLPACPVIPSQNANSDQADTSHPGTANLAAAAIKGQGADQGSVARSTPPAPAQKGDASQKKSIKAELKEKRKVEEALARADDAVYGDGQLGSAPVKAIEGSLEASTFVQSLGEREAVVNAEDVLTVGASDCVYPKEAEEGASLVSERLEDRKDEMRRRAKKMATREVRRRLVEGVERILVALQVTLIFLCLRSKFQRLL